MEAIVLIDLTGKIVAVHGAPLDCTWHGQDARTVFRVAGLWLVAMTIDAAAEAGVATCRVPIDGELHQCEAHRLAEHGGVLVCFAPLKTAEVGR